MEFNYNEAKKFCQILVGGSDVNVTWQVFFDPDNMGQRPDLGKNWTASLDDSLEFIKYRQSQLCGVYLTVNETDGHGRSESNITKIKYFIADYDGMEEPKWRVEPTFTTSRDSTHGHAYWRVLDECGIEDYKVIQKRITLVYNCDERVIDLSRVLRLAGSLHLKTPTDPKMYFVASHSGKEYSVKEFVDAHAMDAIGEAELSNWEDKRQANLSGEGITDNPRYVEQVIKYAKTQATPAVLNNGGSNILLRSCLFAKDRGISYQTCQEIFWEHYNPRCEPPWDDTPQSKSHFFTTIKNGYEYADNASGCHTAVGVFKQLPPIPPPVDGWEENKKLAPTLQEVVVTGDIKKTLRITKLEGEVLLSQCTIKSAHYDLVRAFDGMVFDGERIIRSGEVFYEYDVKKHVWRVIGKDVVRALIQRFFNEYKPSDTFTNGIYNVFRDFVNHEQIDNGRWLNNPDDECRDLTLFKNGIVDFSDVNNITIKPHSVDFFCLNNLGYEWDEEAKCPEWIKFLNTLWDTVDTKLNILTLQEFMGYMLLGDTSLQTFLMLQGLSRGGKGIITTIITAMIGKENVCTPPLSKLNSDSTIHQIIKSKAVLIPDAHTVNRNNRDNVLSGFKAMTGQDDLSYHEMYVGAKTASVSAKVVMTANTMPEFVDSSGALANRMLPIVFHKSFAGKEDRGLSTRLKKEIAGITAWAAKGIKRLRDNNNQFTRSNDSAEELQEIREEMFPLSNFVTQCCRVGTDREVGIDVLYQAYQLHSTIGGVKLPFTKIQFSKTLRTSELQLIKCRPTVDGVRVSSFRGISLNEDMIKKMGVGGFTPVVDSNV